MIKVILITTLTSLSFTGFGAINTVQAKPNGVYNQQTNHAPSLSYVREQHRESRREGRRESRRESHRERQRERIREDRHHAERSTRRERREHRSSYYYGGGVRYPSWDRHHNRRHYGYRQGRHHRDGNLALGIGLGLLTYQLIRSAEPRHQHTYVQQYTQPAPPNTVVYVNRPQTQSSCLQEREYQTVVVIGGQERNAYGTACLQPDGSWKQGPAIVEPVFR